VQKKDLVRPIRRHVPEYMAMGNAGMADMGEMEMSMPDNTLPMMTGFGQFGPMEMGGMFTVVKVREGLAPDDYGDPGPYKNPPGTVAYEFKGTTAEPPRQQSSAKKAGVEVKVVKPGTNRSGHGTLDLFEPGRGNDRC
jgi:hypothetical protein